MIRHLQIVKWLHEIKVIRWNFVACSYFCRNKWKWFWVWNVYSPLKTTFTIFHSFTEMLLFPGLALEIQFPYQRFQCWTRDCPMLNKNWLHCADYYGTASFSTVSIISCWRTRWNGMGKTKYSTSLHFSLLLHQFLRYRVGYSHRRKIAICFAPVQTGFNNVKNP